METIVHIFVRGHYLFREANSFLRAELKDNCELRGTDKYIMSKSKYQSIISPKGRRVMCPRMHHFQVYLVNKPLQAAGMSADNVRG